MGLFLCRDCGQPIHTKSRRCAQCGALTRVGQLGRLGLLAGLGSLALLGLAWGNLESTSTEVAYRVQASLRVREAPGISSPVVTGLSAGETVRSDMSHEIAADGHTWVQVSTAAGSAGWVAKTYLRPVSH